VPPVASSTEETAQKSTIQQTKANDIVFEKLTRGLKSSGEKLLNYIKNDGDTIKWNDSGEIILNDH